MAGDVYKLNEGPSREELFDALRLRHEGRLVSFRSTSGLRYEVSINEIGVESGGGNNWYGTGYLSDGLQIKYYFNTKGRTGTISMI